MRAKQPVSINGIEFDALIDETRSLSATVPQYAVEKGYSVSDNIVNESEGLSMTLFVTNTPVTWHRRFGGDPARVETVVQQMENLYYKKQTVTIYTTDKTYTDMAIETIEFRKSKDIGYAREIPVTFKKIRITEAATTTIPDEYGKSGATGAFAGTANTSVVATDEVDFDEGIEGNGMSIACGMYECGKKVFGG